MRRKFVWVKWRDSAVDSHKYLKPGEKYNPLTIFETAGFLISDTSDAVTLGVDWDDAQESWRGIIGIPKESVVKKKVIIVDV